MTFTDRTEAGRRLAKVLEGRVDPPAVVLALPRGGVPVAVEIAGALGAALDIIGVRKVGAPGRPQFGVGAVTEDGGVFLDQRTIAEFGISREDVAATVETRRREVAHDVARYRGDRPMIDVEGRTVIVVDDGLATGVTAKAAVRAVRHQGAARVLLAVPVCSTEGWNDLARDADEVVCLLVPEHFLAVGQWYQDFAQVTDDEVLGALAEAGQAHGVP